jgi:hypothetical protein
MELSAEQKAAKRYKDLDLHIISAQLSPRSITVDPQSTTSCSTLDIAECLFSSYNGCVPNLNTEKFESGDTLLNRQIVIKVA